MTFKWISFPWPVSLFHYYRVRYLDFENRMSASFSNGGLTLTKLTDSSHNENHGHRKPLRNRTLSLSISSSSFSFLNSDSRGKILLIKPFVSYLSQPNVTSGAVKLRAAS